MSKVDYLKDVIDDLDHEYFGDLWTVAGIKDVSVIKEEFQNEFEGIWSNVTELSIRKSDLPADIREDQLCIRQHDNSVFVIRRILPEVENCYMFIVTSVNNDHQ